MKVFVAPVLNDFWLLFCVENFHSRDDHLIEIWYTSFYGESVLKTSWTICKGKIYTWWMIRGFKRCWFVNPIQYLYFRGCSRIGTVGGKKTPFPKICHTYPTTWYSYTLPKEDPKNMTLPLSSVCISGFSSDISKFYYIKKCRYRLRFGL